MMLLFRVPATAATQRKYSNDLDAVAARHLGWPVMAPQNYAVTYRRDDDKSIWACPGNGHRHLTKKIIDAIAAEFRGTHMDICGMSRSGFRGYTQVMKVATEQGVEYLTGAEVLAAEEAAEAAP